MRPPRRATESSNLTSPQLARRLGGDPLVTPASRDLFSSFSPTLLCPHLNFHTFPLPPFSFILVFFPSFFSHPVTMGDVVIDRVSLWVLSLVSRVQQVHITIWVLLCRNQQVILYHSPDISLIAVASFLCPLCSWQIVCRDSPHRRDFQVSFCTDWMRRTNKVDTVYIRYPAACSE